MDIFDDIKKNVEKMIIRYTVANGAITTTENKKQMAGVTIDKAANTTSQSVEGVSGRLASSFQGKWAGDVKQKLEAYHKKMHDF
ncbi:hypothetical protein HB848_11480 [Listeria rocourtiae]|uniref:hypothetical protein n=1 Tax=Listeria TaxID=1637 RepID=UPI0016273439|nr:MULTISPECIES: hypothetical protein [Listeria]MBC1435960.1 hypothetical protein [Listeria rocourtiae]MBC2080814.1 hypothetical protein [Listeria booriae]